MVKKFVFFIVSSLLVFGVTVFIHLGAYKHVNVVQKKLPAMHLLYKEHEGPYNEIEASLEEVELWARTHGIDCQQTFGEFLDDARTADERRLRSHVGCVLASTPTDHGPYLIEERPAGDYVWTEFDGAPSIGPLKVYPKIYEFMNAHHLTATQPPMEIYTIRNGDSVVTQYLFGLAPAK